MKRFRITFVVLCGLALCTAAFMHYRRPVPGMTADVTATVTSQVIVADTMRFGINLGTWTFWGADQLMSNIIKNPGFEGLLDGAIVLPEHVGEGTFDDNPAWLARPDAFWEGARYSIRTGGNAGRSGVIVHSAAKNLFGLPSFTVQSEGPLPEPAEAVTLSRDREDALPTQWWFSRDPGNAFFPDSTDVRPGSPGVRSLRISGGSKNPAEVASYVDGIGDRAGKLLPLTGSWTLSFWARLNRGQASLRAVLGRQGSAPVLEQSVGITGVWRNFRIPVEAGNDNGSPGLISLRFQVTGEPAGDVLLDDVDLRRNTDADFPFREEVVSTLQTLHPSYLRDWQGQLGDTLANRTALPFARKAWRYRPVPDSQTDFGYGLGEFLDLARKIEAAPWIVIPTVFDDAECAGLGTWLASSGHLTPGREVLVEFGNENWNDLFRPGGIPDPVVHGRAADRCFAAVRENARGVNLKTVINAQFANAERVAEYAAEAHAADIVAVAPYFAFSMAAGLSLDRRNQLLFPSANVPTSRIVRDLARLHKEPAVYEVNLHTVSGTANEAERKPVVAGLASGTALARTLLDSLAHGIRRQCVYSFTGFDAGLEQVKGYTPLWGIVRDVRAANRFRPTGLALKVLNETVGGNMRAVSVEGADDVWVYAFESHGRISVIALSGSAESRRLSVRYPADSDASSGDVRITSLSAPSPESSNEAGTEIAIKSIDSVLREQTASFRLEPWSMAILRPR